MNIDSITLDTSFTHGYECKVLSETSGNFPHYYYPGASSLGGKDGMLIKVDADCTSWVGTFANGNVTSKGISGIYTTPRPLELCVIANGNGYMVSTDNPKNWELIQSNPIIDILPIKANKLLVIATFTYLVAFGPSGIQWTSDRLSWDDLKICDVTSSHIVVEYWDIRTEAKNKNAVDLVTGKASSHIPV